MAFRSPYRDEPKKPPSAVVRWLSRGTVLVIGLVLAYYGVRGLIGLSDLYATERPSLFYTDYRGRYRMNWLVIFAPLSMVVLSFVGATMIAASVLSVETMQNLFERWHRPPVSGDRGGDFEPHRWWWRW